ncbi:response regulator transcription factor [Neptuniibacter caesariensis]|uniref:Regulatory protein, LuxR:Response regulator receiver n=1 Tax=Neptuniibacter caesariensis TaxID=207954 RepID=A0A7U8GTV7_NEPCE|nr:response regulator [Neptuniibacter caesariensis]EAR62707.1 regulatory protein, LuxR:Response regulator receiver [Oceanospirillum sp. MED92] [Neptuniibacter caesariensis]
MSEQIVFVVDDDEDVRDSLQWLLESVDLNVRSYESAQAFMDAYPQGQSGCVLMDVRMPGLSGLSAQKKLPEYEIDIPLIMISAHGNVDTAVTAMTQGARTFLEKPFNDQSLIDHVQKALAQDLAQRESRQRKHHIAALFNALTKREKQVFERVIKGASNQDMADDLGINRKTIEGHRANLMNKMEADSLADLIQMAVILGLVGANS